MTDTVQSPNKVLLQTLSPPPKTLTTTNAKHLPKIKTIKNIHIIKPITENKEMIPPSQSHKKSALNPIQFAQYHNRNLDILKRISRKYNMLHGSQNKREETSMERFNKIKKYFNMDCVNSREKEKEEKIKTNFTKIEGNFYYQITKGNNAELITKCFKHRINWKDSTESPITLVSNEINLLWVPTSGAIQFSNFIYEKEKENCQMVNHFEFHQAISNKLKMFSNIMKYCENHNLDIFSYLPFTIQIQYENANYLNQINSFSYLFTHIHEFLNKNTKTKYKDYFYIDPVNEKIGSKTSLYIHKNHFTDKNLWLIKAINLNRGRCIRIADSVEAAENIIKHFYQGVKKGFKEDESEEEDNKNNSSMRNLILPKISLSKVAKAKKTSKNFLKVDYSIINSKTFNKEKYQSSLVILQKYIEKPLLYQGRKFDMRIWVLLTHKMELFYFKEGHLKATSVKYDITSKNCFVHLTNYSVQKYNENFSKFEYGNEISFSDFENSLLDDLKVAKNFRSDILPKIAEIIKLSMLSVKDIINQNERKFCFEIFGYDFMFDSELNPFLIEVNTNPGLEISSPLISSLVPRMIDDSLRLTVDEIFVPKFEWSDAMYHSPFPVKGYHESENLWELICDLSKEECKKK